jgi:hypothetical protein
MRIFILILAIMLCGCVRNYPCAYVNGSQKDYWADQRTDIFARKNCVGDTGRWISDKTGSKGFYCLGPQCIARDPLNCKDTCYPSY